MCSGSEASTDPLSTGNEFLDKALVLHLNNCNCLLLVRTGAWWQETSWGGKPWGGLWVSPRGVSCHSMEAAVWAVSCVPEVPGMAMPCRSWAPSVPCGARRCTPWTGCCGRRKCWRSSAS